MDLFAYGTLMVPEIMRAVCGYAPAGEPALLRGFRRRRVHGEVYPAIVAHAGESVAGIVYRAVNAAQLAALDAFEGEMYRRVIVDVTIARQPARVAAYVLVPDWYHRLSDEPWTLGDFLQQGLGRFLAGYPGFAGVSGDRRRDDGR